ncbi:MAG: hypothetical protein WCO84_05810 [bacterium]
MIKKIILILIFLLSFNNAYAATSEQINVKVQVIGEIGQNCKGNGNGQGHCDDGGVQPPPPVSILKLEVAIKSCSGSIELRTNLPTKYVVNYGDSCLSLNKTYTYSGDYSRQHMVLLPDLLPNKMYCFQVNATDGNGHVVLSNPRTFQTAPLPNQGMYPHNVSDFEYSSYGNGLSFKWKNPPGLQESGYVRVVRSDRFFPKDIYDGVPVFEKKYESFDDDKLEDGKKYYYTTFVCDNNYSCSNSCSSGASISVTFSKTKLTPIEKIKELIDNALNPKPVGYQCEFELSKYIKLGANNDAEQVIKLKKFLRDHEGEGALNTDGVYDQKTADAVIRFQEKYSDDVLLPWGHLKGTAYVYQTTIKKINDLMCGEKKEVNIPENEIPEKYRGKVIKKIDLQQTEGTANFSNKNYSVLAKKPLNLKVLLTPGGEYLDILTIDVKSTDVGKNIERTFLAKQDGNSYTYKTSDFIINELNIGNYTATVKVFSLKKELIDQGEISFAVSYEAPKIDINKDLTKGASCDVYAFESLSSFIECYWWITFILTMIFIRVLLRFDFLK